jgi:hypothetical protein
MCVTVWVPTHPRRNRVMPFPVGVDRVWLGSQAFLGANVFNANIGAWNTAAVTSLSSVCAASGPAARDRRRSGRARLGFDARVRAHM